MEATNQMDPATWTRYQHRIADVEEPSQLDVIIAELRARLERDPADLAPRYLIGMAKMEGHLSFGRPL